MKGVVILGSTGSIGTQTLDVIRALPDAFKVIGLAAGTNVQLLQSQIDEFHPKFACMTEPVQLPGTSSVYGKTMDEMVVDPSVDLVMVATTGKAGLSPTLQALRAGKAVALSNKETIVMAGAIIMQTASTYGATVLPVDSEPSAIWQCIRGEESPIDRLIITASGGPFRTFPLEEIGMVTATQALAHPTWTMGRKITIDSSTLMNKGFEVIESHYLFDMPFKQIDVVIHPQSIIHSMVEFADGSVKAQMGPPDMRLPIQYAMSYPNRMPSEATARYDPLQMPELTFEPLDPARYPCFETALEAGVLGETYPAVLSAADEEAVYHFLRGSMGFQDIHKTVHAVLDRHEPWPTDSIEAILEADNWAREEAKAVMSRL